MTKKKCVIITEFASWGAYINKNVRTYTLHYKYRITLVVVHFEFCYPAIEIIGCFGSVNIQTFDFAIALNSLFPFFSVLILHIVITFHLL